MIPEKEYPAIAAGLLDKSRRGAVDWTEVENHFGQTWYSLALPESSIQLSYQTPETEPNYFLLKFFNKEDRAVGTWIVSEGDEGWEVISDLYSEVVRQITGWDKVLEDVKKFVGK